MLFRLEGELEIAKENVKLAKLTLNLAVARASEYADEQMQFEFSA